MKKTKLQASYDSYGVYRHRPPFSKNGASTRGCMRGFIVYSLLWLLKIGRGTESA